MITILPSDLQKALNDIRKFSDTKIKNSWNEIRKAGFDIDKRQKLKLKFHSSVSGKNYSAMIASNRIVINESSKIFDIKNDHKAAIFFEEGTKPHPIRIKNKKVLATLREYTGGKTVNTSTDKQGNEWAIFGKEVKHPGTKPKPFFYNPVLIVGKIMVENIKKILSNAE